MPEHRLDSFRIPFGLFCVAGVFVCCLKILSKNPKQKKLSERLAESERKAAAAREKLEWANAERDRLEREFQLMGRQGEGETGVLWVFHFKPRSCSLLAPVLPTLSYRSAPFFAVLYHAMPIHAVLCYSWHPGKRRKDFAHVLWV